MMSGLVHRYLDDLNTLGLRVPDGGKIAATRSAPPGRISRRRRPLYTRPGCVTCSRVNTGKQSHRPDGAGFAPFQLQRQADEKEALPSHLIQVDERFENRHAGASGQFVRGGSGGKGRRTVNRGEVAAYGFDSTANQF